MPVVTASAASASAMGGQGCALASVRSLPMCSLQPDPRCPPRRLQERLSGCCFRQASVQAGGTPPRQSRAIAYRVASDIKSGRRAVSRRPSAAAAMAGSAGKPVVTVDIWSDLSCPWCWVGA